MALVKTVEMRVLAKSGEAQAKLDELAGKADKLSSDGIRMRFRVDDAKGKAELDEIEARAKRLGFKDVSIKVKVDGAGKAIADLVAVKHEEDAVARRGIMDRIGALFTNPAGGGPLNGLIGNVGGAIPGGPMIAGIGLLLPVIGALATELLGVASGFAAAGAGAGAFALLAMPAVKQVMGAYQGLSKAQAAYDQAVAKEKLDPTKGNQSAVKSALDNLNLAGIAIGKLPGSEQKAVDGIFQLTRAFGQMSRAFAPQAFKVFADGLQVINNLLPHLTPFANTFANALDGMLKKLAGVTEAPRRLQRIGPFIDRSFDQGGNAGFQKFLDQLHRLEGPALNSIVQGIGKVAAAIGHLLTIMSGKDVAHALNIMFDGAAGAINAAASGIHRFMQNFDSMKATATRDAHQIAASFDVLRHAAATVGHDVASAFDTVRHAMATLVSSIAHGTAQVVTFFVTLPARILRALGNVGSLLFDAGRNIIQGLINGIESMIGAVANAIGGIVSKIRSFLPFSPAKEGPLSGTGSPDIAGVKIAAMLAGGIDQGRGQVARAAGRLAGAAMISPGGYGRGGGDIHVQFNGVVGDPQAAARQVVQVLRQYKRTGGGVPLGIA